MYLLYNLWSYCPQLHVLSVCTYDMYIVDCKVQTTHEPTPYRYMEETFDEEKMLQFMKREQELGGSIDEQNNLKRPIAVSGHRYEHEVCVTIE